MAEFPTTSGRRHPERVSSELEVVKTILDSNYLGHLGVVQDGFPIVMPMGYVRIDNEIFLHGAAANQALKLATDSPCSFCVTSINEMVLAETMFNHSFNYACAVIFGVGRAVKEPSTKDHILKRFIDSIYPGRSEKLPKNTKTELLSTAVISIDLDRSTAKIRTGPPESGAAVEYFVGNVRLKSSIDGYYPVPGSTRVTAEIDPRLALD